MGFSDAAPGACIDGGAGTGTGGLLSHDALIVGMPQRCYGLRLTVAAADTGALLQSWICAGGFLLADCRSQAVAQGRGVGIPIGMAAEGTGVGGVSLFCTAWGRHVSFVIMGVRGWGPLSVEGMVPADCHLGILRHPELRPALVQVPACKGVVQATGSGRGP